MVTVVALCFAATYFVGWANPDVLAVSINGQSVNLLTAVYITIMAGFLFYAKEVSQNRVDIIIQDIGGIGLLFLCVNIHC